MHILICPGEGFLLCESSQEKEVTLGLSRLLSLFPKGWAGQAVSEQECQVSESVSFGADRWKGNWWLTEITSPAHFLCRAGLWLFPPKFWNAPRMVIPIPQWLKDGVSSHSGPLLEKCLLYQSKLLQLLWHQGSHPFSVCRDMNKPSSPRFLTLGFWPGKPDK